MILYDHTLFKLKMIQVRKFQYKRCSFFNHLHPPNQNHHSHEDFFPATPQVWLGAKSNDQQERQRHKQHKHIKQAKSLINLGRPQPASSRRIKYKPDGGPRRCSRVSDADEETLEARKSGSSGMLKNHLTPIGAIVLDDEISMTLVKRELVKSLLVRDGMEWERHWDFVMFSPEAHKASRRRRLPRGRPWRRSDWLF